MWRLCGGITAAVRRGLAREPACRLPGRSGPGCGYAACMDGALFSQASARGLLADAGLDTAGAQLLALGENAVFALASGRVAKVGRAGRAMMRRAEHELRVAHWLAEYGIPAVRPAVAVPLLARGHPVTVWERLPRRVRTAVPADLAELLTAVHALPATVPGLPLPRRDLLGGVERWLRAGEGHIDTSDAAFLRDRRDRYAEACADLVPVLPPGPIHGDALPRNVWVGPEGPLLVDLETFSWDLREHDLVVMALARKRYGVAEASYAAFVDAYGWDVGTWEGCPVLVGARETASAAWVAQHAPTNPAAREEFRRRVTSLREGDATRRWHAL